MLPATEERGRITHPAGLDQQATRPPTPTPTHDPAISNTSAVNAGLGRNYAGEERILNRSNRLAH